MKIKTELILVVIVGIVVTSLQFFFLRTFHITQDTVNNLVVFVSIAFGFFATSLAIFATSKYSGKLYDIEDRKNGGTLLHTLVKKYKIGLFFALIAIIYFVVLGVYLGDNDFILTSEPVALPLLGLISINVFYAYRLIQIVAQFVLQEAKGN